MSSTAVTVSDLMLLRRGNLRRVMRRHRSGRLLRGIYRSYRHRRLDPNPYCPQFAASNSIFVHIPKAAGNAVTQGLYGLDSLQLAGHTPAVEFRAADQERFASSFVFTFARHPVDRFVSSFSFLRLGGMTDADRAWSEEYLGQFSSVSDFVGALRDRRFRAEALDYIHFRPQSFYLCDRSGQLLVDFVGRYERLADDYELVRQKLGGQPLAPTNVTPRSNKLTIDLTADAAKLVAVLYADDMALLGYNVR